MISFESRGSFDRTESFLTKIMNRSSIFSALDKLGQQGVNALASATPHDTGNAANSWSYEITSSRGSHAITWTNSDAAGGLPLVLMLQYGHGTGTGGWVSGRDFINPAIKPVMDRIANDVWKAVTSA